MKKKLIGSIICTLLISSSVMALSENKILDTTTNPISRGKQKFSREN